MSTQIFSPIARASEPDLAPVGDFLGQFEYLAAEERIAIAKVREYLAKELAPIADDCWERAEFPHQIVAPLAELNVFAFGYEQTRPFQNSAVFRGLLNLEIARVDASVATFAGVHAGLAMGSVALCGSDAQRAYWLPRMASGQTIGAFALTEPEHGSDVAGGLATVAQRIGDEWTLSGAKRWIGNATFAEIMIVWARDAEGGAVKGFVVPRDTPGVSVSRIESKYSLRTVQNADVKLEGVRLDESFRLQHANSFADTARVLSQSRLEVAFSAIGNAMGAYEKARSYTLQRRQLGRPIAEFQLVQDLLVRALGNVTSALALAVSVARMHDESRQKSEHSSMAKLVVLGQCREAVALCREVVGGNGIVLEHGVIRHFMDAEAQYSFEGTREINALIVGRAITGKAAFA